MKHLPLQNEHFERIFSDFRQFIRVRAYSRGKNEMYPTCVREFLFFAENRDISNIQEVKTKDIITYYQYLCERPNQRRAGGLSDSMIRHHLFSLRLLFDYLMDTDVIESSPAFLPKFSIVKYQARQILSEEEIKELFRVVIDKREKALLAIAYGCGLRRTEMVNLDVGDILFHKGTLTVRDGKFGKSRVVPLSDSILTDLRDYLINERFTYITTPNGTIVSAFLLNNKGSRTSGQYLAKMLQRIIERTQNPAILRKQITLHCLRHSIATHLVDHGAALEFVQEFLGHSEIDSSALYAKRRKQRMKIQSQI
jgi:integrase/recombinase XerD